MEFRDSSIDDLDEILKIEQTTRVPMFPNVLEDALLADTEDIIVENDDGEIIGYLLTTDKHDVGDIYITAREVREDYDREEILGKMLDRTDATYCHVAKDNEEEIHLLESRGFMKAESMKWSISGGIPGYRLHR